MTESSTDWASSRRSMTSISSSSRLVMRRSSDSSSWPQALEVLGVADLAGVHPLPVAGAAGLDLLDVGVDLGLLGAQVVDDDPGVAGLVVELGAVGLQLGDLGDLGQGAALVAQLVGPGVELLELEQGDLGGGSAFSGLSWLWGVRRGGTSTGRCTGCSRGSPP